MRSHSLSCPTTLRDGLARTVDWYEANYRKQSDHIRL